MDASVNGRVYDYLKYLYMSTAEQPISGKRLRLLRICEIYKLDRLYARIIEEIFFDGKLKSKKHLYKWVRSEPTRETARFVASRIQKRVKEKLLKRKEERKSNLIR